MIYLEKKSIVKLPETTGSISNTINVEDKITNAPSINLVQQMTGIPTDGIIMYNGTEDTIPEGYELVDVPSETPTTPTIDWSPTLLCDVDAPSSNTAYSLSESYTDFHFIAIVVEGQFSGADVNLIPTALIDTAKKYGARYHINEAQNVWQVILQFNNKTVTTGQNIGTSVKFSVYGICRKG